jgi:hypothetical protein
MTNYSDMINSVVIHDAVRRQWLHFGAPEQIISAHRMEEVIPALKTIEEQVYRHGLYAAGFIAYEAATAFDSALAVRRTVYFRSFGSASTANLSRLVSLQRPRRSRIYLAHGPPP